MSLYFGNFTTQHLVVMLENTYQYLVDFILSYVDLQNSFRLKWNTIDLMGIMHQMHQPQLLQIFKNKF